MFSSLSISIHFAPKNLHDHANQLQVHKPMATIRAFTSLRETCDVHSLNGHNQQRRELLLRAHLAESLELLPLLVLLETLQEFHGLREMTDVLGVKLLKQKQKYGKHDLGKLDCTSGDSGASINYVTRTELD